MADVNMLMDIIDEAIKAHKDAALSSVRTGYADDEAIIQLAMVIELQEIKIIALERLSEEGS